MAVIQLNLSKETKAPIQLSLSKVNKYIVDLFWDSKHDLDVHAIALQDGHYTGADDILSTYNPNLVLVDNPNINHTSGGKGPFQSINGSMVHNGDRRSGIQANQQSPDEQIEINIAKIPANINEISFFVTIHPAATAKFREVNDAKMIIKDDSNKELLQANLTNDFDQYDFVQMGSIVRNSTGGWDFNPVAFGENGDFNTILSMLG